MFRVSHVASSTARRRAGEEEPLRENRSEQRAPSEGASASVAAEVLRLAAVPSEPGTVAKPAKPEERASAFWHFFGTTLLSISALIAITLYQQLSNGLNEVRSEVKSISETSSDLVKKEEFTNGSLGLSNSLKELQANNTAAMDLWRERAALLDRQVQAGQDEHKQQVKELTRELQRLRERLAVVESRLAAPPPAAGSDKKHAAASTEPR
jgi:hypothetical protein